jgi:hypothetical protein
VLRVSFADGVDDRGLGRTVHFGDVVALLLDADRQPLDVVAGAVDDLTGAARGLDGDIERGMHDGPNCTAAKAAILI